MSDSTLTPQEKEEIQRRGFFVKKMPSFIVSYIIAISLFPWIIILMWNADIFGFIIIFSMFFLWRHIITFFSIPLYIFYGDNVIFWFRKVIKWDEEIGKYISRLNIMKVIFDKIIHIFNIILFIVNSVAYKIPVYFYWNIMGRVRRLYTWFFGKMIYFWQSIALSIIWLFCLAWVVFFVLWFLLTIVLAIIDAPAFILHSFNFSFLQWFNLPFLQWFHSPAIGTILAYSIHIDDLFFYFHHHLLCSILFYVSYLSVSIGIIFLIRFLSNIFHPLTSFVYTWERIQHYTRDFIIHSNNIQENFKEKLLNCNFLKDFKLLASFLEKINRLVSKIEVIESTLNMGDVFQSKKYIASLKEDICKPLYALSVMLGEKRSEIIVAIKELNTLKEWTAHTLLHNKRLENLLTQVEMMISLSSKLLLKINIHSSLSWKW